MTNTMLVKFLALLAAGALAGCAADPGRPASPGAVALGADQEPMLLRIAASARMTGAYAAAVPLYQRAVQVDPKSVAAHLGLADSLLGVVALDAAADEYRQASALDQGEVEAHLGLGRVMLAKHDGAAALVEFQRAAQSPAAAAKASNGEGIALDFLGRHGEAQASYQAGLAVQPNDRALRNNYALSLIMSGSSDKAAQILETLVSEPGATARTRQNLALSLGLEGDQAAAGRVAAADLDPSGVDGNLRFYDAARTSLAALPRADVGAPPAADAGKPGAR